MNSNYVDELKDEIEMVERMIKEKNIELGALEDHLDNLQEELRQAKKYWNTSLILYKADTSRWLVKGGRRLKDIVLSFLVGLIVLVFIALTVFLLSKVMELVIATIFVAAVIYLIYKIGDSILN